MTPSGAKSTAPARAVRSAATRQRLLDAALDLFRERGYHGAGTNEIGAAAGLTGPSIYRHFASKDDILVTALLQAGARLAKEADDVRQASDPFVGLRALCRSFAAYGIERPEVYAAYFFEAKHASPEAAAALEAAGRRFLDVPAGFLAALDPSLSAAEIEVRVSCALQMTASMCQQPSALPPSEYAAVLADRMLAVVLAPTPKRPRATTHKESR